MPYRFGFFSYEPRNVDPGSTLERFRALFESAEKIAGRIDAVIFPEVALTREEFRRIERWLQEKRCILVAGVSDTTDKGNPGKNSVEIRLPLLVANYEGSLPITQWKHHRWCLDRRQIIQYSLGGQLDPSKVWWEHIQLAERRLAVIAVGDLALCALVCEDLARQDPLARLVRAVGPSLVIALLMDGPQVAERWSARYATVLADDPGSSVLTLTSLGMCQSCNPPGFERSRAIGLWKDAKSGSAVRIELDAGAEGVVLNLFRHRDQEWTADGRERPREALASYPVLAGVHQVYGGLAGPR
jgi:hypothetical protein